MLKLGVCKNIFNLKTYLHINNIVKYCTLWLLVVYTKKLMYKLPQNCCQSPKVHLPMNSFLAVVDKMCYLHLPLFATFFN